GTAHRPVEEATRGCGAGAGWTAAASGSPPLNLERLATSAFGTPARIQQLRDLDVVQPPRPSANRGELEGNLLAALIQQLSVGWAGHGRTCTSTHQTQKPGDDRMQRGAQ